MSMFGETAGYKGTSWLTPELAKSPALATAAIKTQNPAQSAHPLSMAKHGTATADAITDNATANNDQSTWDHIVSTVLGNKTTTAIFDKLSFLNKPLEEVSKDYKFLHSVWADHGPVHGLLATAGVIAGGVGGFFAAGPAGAYYGAEAVAASERQILGRTMYKNSYTKSENEDYKISFGRDFANGIGELADAVGADGLAQALHKQDSGIGQWVSGTADAVFDYKADPLMVLTRASTMMKQGRYLERVKGGAAFEYQAKYPLMRSIPGAQDFIMAHTGRALNPEQIDAVRAGGFFNQVSRNYNNSLKVISDLVHNSGSVEEAAGRINYAFGNLGTAAAGRLAERVGMTKTVEEGADVAHDFFKTQLFFGELQGTLNGAALLPSRTLLRSKFATPVADYLRNKGPKAVQDTIRTFTGYMPFSIDPITNELSSRSFHFAAPDSAGVIYRIGRFSLGHDAAIELSGQYAVAAARGDLAMARAIKNQTVFEMMKGLGLPDSNELVMAAKRELDKVDAPLIDRVYGVRPDGSVIADYTTTAGEMANSGLSGWQTTETFNIPNFDALRMAMHQTGGMLNSVHKLDDFMFKPVMSAVWKPLALVNMGFGLRVAAAEAMQAISRYSLGSYFKSSLAATVAKSGIKLAKDEESHVAGAVMQALGLNETRQSLADKMLHAAEAEGLTADERMKLVAKLDPNVDPLEDMPVWKQAKLQGLTFASKLLPEDYMDVATRLVMKHDGHLLSNAVDASGHSSLGSDSLDLGITAHTIYNREVSRVKYRQSGNWNLHATDNNEFVPRYSTLLRHWRGDAMGRIISGDALKTFEKISTVDINSREYFNLRQQLVNNEKFRIQNTIDGNFKPYAEEYKKTQRWFDQSIDEFAGDRVDTILGIVIGRDGSINKKALDFMSKTEKFGGLKDADARELAKTMTSGQRPVYVAGAEITPYVDKNMWQKVIDYGFRFMVDPVLNHFARQPLYTLHVTDELFQFRGLMEKGLIDSDFALSIAENRATRAMIPQIHNPALRSQFAKMTETFLPFYFAQEQAMRRTFAAMKDTSFGSPVFSNTLRMYQIAHQALNNPAWIEEDQSGNKYVTIPAAGAFGEALMNALAKIDQLNMVSGLPLTVSGNIASLNTVLPEINTPGLSPKITIPLKAVLDLWPGAPAIIETLAGRAANTSLIDAIIPNQFAKSVWAALQTGNDAERTTVNAIFGALAAGEYHGIFDGYQQATAEQRKSKIDQFRNNISAMFMFKAGLNLISMLSPKVELSDAGMRQEFLDLLTANKGDYPKSLMEYLGKYGVEAAGYTVSKSQSGVSGASIPLTSKAMDWIQKNRAIIDDPATGRAAAFLVPQDQYDDPNKFAIYNQMLQQNIRSLRTPAEFLNQIDITAGAAIMDPLIKNHKAVLAANVHNQYATDKENAAWSDIQKQASVLLPMWYNEYTSRESKTNAEVTLKQFRTIFNGKNAPKNPQSKMIQEIIGLYDEHVNTLSHAKSIGSTYQANAESVRWSSGLDNLKATYPELVPVINSVFAKLD